MQTRRLLCLLVLLEGLVMHSAAALDIETLVMPDEVVASHAEFETECSACHAAFSRDRQNSLCLDCHQKVGADQQAGRGFHGRDVDAQAAECAACHTEHIGRDGNIIVFAPQSFDHASTDFELLDKHIDVECEDCHEPAASYRDAPSQCVSCHLEDDVHAAGLGEECASCHAPAGWDVVDFEHELETGFALLDGHSDLACGDCHSNQTYTETDSECVACHLDDDVHQDSREPDCGVCHTTLNWQKSFFDHAMSTRFPLRGAHVRTDCEQCHVATATSMQLETECVACHRLDDSHDGLLGEACADCHGEVSWADNQFEHASFSDFALVGSHELLECQACHVAPVHESNLGSDCYACHKDDDPHKGQLGEACGDCHGEQDWLQDVRFDHDLGVFPLVGAHSQATCSDCHADAQFRDASAECVDCHGTEDIHKGRLGADCAACHSPTAWDNWRFNHELETGFDLTGAHTLVRCQACHRRPSKPGVATGSRCIDCHRNDDVHDGQFGKDCARCHSVTTFSGAEEFQ
jgi:hypothetical protein